MSFFGKIGHGLKKVGGAVGDVVKVASPLATFIPGVGPVAAGLIGAGAGALGTLNDDDASVGGALKGAAGYGALGYGGAKGLDALHLGGAGGASSAASGLMGGAGDAIGSAKSGMDLKDWLTLGTAGAGALAGAYGDYQSGKQNDAAMAEDTRRYDQEFAEGQKRYGDQRADIDFDRDRRRRSGVAINPLVAGLLAGGGLRRSGTQME